MYYIKIENLDYYFIKESYHAPNDMVFFSLYNCKNGFRTPKTANKYAKILTKKLNRNINISIIYKEE